VQPKVKLEKTLSVVIPAFNEERNIAQSLDEVLEGCKVLPGAYEVIIVNDNSTDRTGEIAESYAKKFPQVRVLHNEKNLGFGGAFRRGLMDAKMNYAVMMVADDGIPADSIREIFSHLGEADLVIPYTINPEARPMSRRVVSRIYVGIMNTLFGNKLRYYNGHNIFPTREIQQMKTTGGFAFSAQMIVRLLKRGYTYVDCPMKIKQRVHGETKAFRLKNFLQVGKAIGVLWWEVYGPHSTSGNSLKSLN
jgi:glycosyltransferase involved in cell wall biosynthesis